MMGVPGGPPPPDAPFGGGVKKIYITYVHKSYLNVYFHMLKFVQYAGVKMSGYVLTPYAPGEGDE